MWSCLTLALAMQVSARTKPLLAVLSLLLCTWYVVARDPMTSLDAFAESLPEALQVVLVIVVLPFMLLFSFSFMIGTALLALLAWLRFGRATSSPGWFQPIVLPLLSMCWAAAQAVPLFRVPAGEAIRPMAWAAYVLMGALALTVLSIISTISAFKRRGSSPVCVLALALSLTVLVIPTLSLHAVAKIKGFTLAP
jgi:hypothetical protein